MKRETLFSLLMFDCPESQEFLKEQRSLTKRLRSLNYTLHPKDCLLGGEWTARDRCDKRGSAQLTHPDLLIWRSTNSRGSLSHRWVDWIRLTLVYWCSDRQDMFSLKLLQSRSCKMGGESSSCRMKWIWSRNQSKLVQKQVLCWFWLNQLIQIQFQYFLIWLFLRLWIVETEVLLLQTDKMDW